MFPRDDSCHTPRPQNNSLGDHLPAKTPKKMCGCPDLSRFLRYTANVDAADAGIRAIQDDAHRAIFVLKEEGNLGLINTD
jgi:hypothetical protein